MMWQCRFERESDFAIHVPQYAPGKNQFLNPALLLVVCCERKELKDTVLGFQAREGCLNAYFFLAALPHPTLRLLEVMES